jgi:hypothetical protein
MERGRLLQGDGGHLHAAESKDQRGQEPDGPCAEHRGAARPPHPEPTLDLKGLGDTLLHHGGRLQQHADTSEPTGDPD